MRFITIPEFDPHLFGGGCDPFLVIEVVYPDEDDQPKRFVLYDMLLDDRKKIRKYKNHDGIADISLERNSIILKGTIKIMVRDLDINGSSDSMFHMWFNTSFVSGNHLVFEKNSLDKANKVYE